MSAHMPDISGNYSIASHNGLPVSGPSQDNEKQLKQACQAFESVLVNHMLKAMRSTVPKNDLFSGGAGEEMFTGMLDEEYAQLMTKRGESGLAAILYAQLCQQETVK